MNDHDMRRAPDTSLETCRTKAKFMLTLLPPTIEEAPKTL